MSAFDEARGGARTGGAGGAGGARGRGGAGGGARSGGAFDAAGSSAIGHAAALGSGSYQNGADSTYAILKESIERDLRKLTTIIAATRKLSEQLGSRQDTSELRKRMCVDLPRGLASTLRARVVVRSTARSAP